jgi:hypothetical protein
LTLTLPSTNTKRCACSFTFTTPTDPNTAQAQQASHVAWNATMTHPLVFRGNPPRYPLAWKTQGQNWQVDNVDNSGRWVKWHQFVILSFLMFSVMHKMLNSQNITQTASHSTLLAVRQLTPMAVAIIV